MFSPPWQGLNPASNIDYRGNACDNPIVHDGHENGGTIESRITSQGQVSIPARIRRRLGLTKGSRIEWCERGEEVIVRRASTYSSLDIHRAVFSRPPPRKSLASLDEGIRSHMRRSHARR
ncbi:MAG: AbrB/MazE/SpoVT family DNA-binding domain-containing protein [Acidobacteria bacterium]|nr:AbrB/MazE/SpoVT family DNA-binding domain-containing protein [Acidobacteriota bacterium]MYD69444.1 AbrB/MazE/SpoVT family DNA-binding domain-containing protein [Acidobacteriota bacterium]